MINGAESPNVSKRRLLAGAAVGVAVPLFLQSNSTSAASSSSVKGVVSVDAAAGPDLSNAIRDAIASLTSSGGGIVDVPAGTYYVQGVVVPENIYIRGQGRHATVLCLPDNASTHMFSLAVGSNRIITNGPGFYSMTLLGKLKPISETDYAAYNAIDASSAVAIFDYFVENCTFQFFNIAYQGASYNKFPQVNNQYYSKIWNCRFQNNNLAVYADEEIEISYTTLNNNNVAYQGRPNDAKVSHCEFEGNNIAIMPTYADEGSIRNFLISNCIFFKNQIFDVKLGDNCVVSGCSFVGDPTASSFGIGVVGNTVRIANCKFNEGNGEYMDACIKVLGRSSVSYVQDISVSDCNYLSTDLANAGPFVEVALLNSASDLARISIMDCNWSALTNQLFVSSSPNAVSDYCISGNQVYLFGGSTDALSGSALIYIAGGHGGSIVNNRFISNAILTCFAGSLGQLMVFGNTFRANGANICKGFSSSASFTSDSIIKDNVGLRTKTKGLATVANTSYVVVNHQIELGVPSPADISLAALTNLSGVSMWLSKVDNTVIVINFSAPVTTTIAWSAEVYQ